MKNIDNQSKHLKPFLDSQKFGSRFNSRRSSSASDYFFRKKIPKEAVILNTNEEVLESSTSTTHLDIDSRFNQEKIPTKTDVTMNQSADIFLLTKNLSYLPKTELPVKMTGKLVQYYCLQLFLFKLFNYIRKKENSSIAAIIRA